MEKNQEKTMVVTKAEYPKWKDAYCKLLATKEQRRQICPLSYEELFENKYRSAQAKAMTRELQRQIRAMRKTSALNLIITLMVIFLLPSLFRGIWDTLWVYVAGFALSASLFPILFTKYALWIIAGTVPEETEKEDNTDKKE